ncbi:MAG: polysaccharide biosynthesis/export family protein [Rhodobacteraceae bacterium]|nr:polysaccharide biosynthesis/export family protein [Paracoccaceae bacterium]
MINLSSATKIAAVFLSAGLLFGCGGGGPSARDTLQASEGQQIDKTVEAEPFVLVDVGLSFAERISASMQGIYPSMPRSGPQPIVIGVNDVIDISLVLNSEAGFIDFAQSAISPIATTPLPQQVVAEDGTVAVPLLGRVKASGRSVQALESQLTDQLAEVLIDPTAFVQLVERRSATVLVSGKAVGTAGRYPIDLTNRRLLDILAQAGGTTGEPEDLVVRLTRRGQSYQALLSDIQHNSSLNVNLHKNDLIAVNPWELHVQVQGAAVDSTTVTFDKADASLMDVLGAAGGLTSPRANLKGVFVYRKSPRHQLAALGADLTPFPGRKTIPTIYRIDMTEPTAFFTAEAFRVMDGDILYATDSLVTRLTNFFDITGFFFDTPAVYLDNAING